MTLEEACVRVVVAIAEGVETIGIDPAD